MLNLNKIFLHYFPKNIIQIGEIYSATFQVLSDTHFINGLLDTYKIINNRHYPLISFLENNENMMITLKRPKLNFFSPSENTLDFKFKFEEIIKDYVIGLSIITRGIFFPFRLGGLDFKYDLLDSEIGNIAIKIQIDGIRPTKYNNMKKFGKKKIHLYHLVFPLLWTNYREKLKWDQIHYFYGKALILLSQYDIVDRFFDEIFMLFYKIFENISTFDILNKKKLDNELRELQSVVDLCITNKNLKLGFKKLYLLRCRVIAHSQNAKHELATFQDVLEIKQIVDITIIYILFSNFMNDKHFEGNFASKYRT